MHNVFLNERSVADIDARVAKVLKDLDVVEPPLHLELVRDALELDRAYYSSADTTAVQETIHRLRVAGKQVIQRPCLLWEAIQKLDVRALYVPDRKRILIDSELPPTKQRWGEGHEIGHSLLPWHEAVMHGDLKQTLSLVCQQEIEAEANYAAGRLLFLQDLFREMLVANEITFKEVKGLAKAFGNSMTSTLWRTIESLDVPACGMVTQHPNRKLQSDKPVIRYFVRSQQFADKFGTIAAPVLYAEVQNYCYGQRGPIGNDDVVLEDENGIRHVFRFESFFNGHEALTLGIHQHAMVASNIPM